MGVDLVRFRLRPGVDRSEVAAAVEMVARSSGEREGRLRATSQLESLIEIDVGPTDSLALDADRARLERCSMLRAAVVAANSTLPLEWRDEIVAPVLPDRLPELVGRWRDFIDAVRSGGWRGYQFDLYLTDRVTDEHDLEQVLLLSRLAAESRTRSNAWASKAAHIDARDRVLRSDVSARWSAMRDQAPVPHFDPHRSAEGVTDQQRAQDWAATSLRSETSALIKRWNGTVPTGQKVRFPQSWSYEAHLEQADDRWLDVFLDWGETLVRGRYGLYPLA